jgi:hypothetical protein
MPLVFSSSILIGLMSLVDGSPVTKSFEFPCTHFIGFLKAAKFGKQGSIQGIPLVNGF